MRAAVALLVLVMTAACTNDLEPLAGLRSEDGAGAVDGDKPLVPSDPPPHNTDPPDQPVPPPNDTPPPPPPPPPAGGNDFDDAPSIACGQLVSGTVGATPEWFRLDTSDQRVVLTLHADGVDVDLHVTSGPAVPNDVIAASESPGGHEVVEVLDRGVVGVRVLLFAGAPSASFSLAIACTPLTPEPPANDPPASEPPPLPAELQCISYPTQNARTMTGSALKDIVRHLPDDQVDYYCDADLITCAHEVSHGIHAYLRNYFNPNDAPSNALYVLQDRACFVVEPGIWKHEVIPFVPQALHEFRYETYVSGQDAWDDTPLYLWDEWNAYVNGGEAALSMFDEGVWQDGWRDQSGVIEFVAYGVAVGMAVKQNDAGYLATGNADGAQFRAMLAYLTRRSLELHRRFAQMPDFQSDTSDALYTTLRTGAAAAPIRAFLAQTYGQVFHDEVLDLP